MDPRHALAWRTVLVVAALTGVVAGCDFEDGLRRCVNEDGRCPSDGGRDDGGTGKPCETDGGTLWLGPAKYSGIDFSPFPCRGASEFFWNDFEATDFLPGAAASTTSRNPTQSVDSVDNDDGLVDGKCRYPDGGYCRALYTLSGETGISVEFDAGALPTFVGLVWTDGRKFIRFEAFGPDHKSLGVFGPWSEAGSPDSDTQGLTAEDRFLGVVDRRGISKVWITSGDAGGMEVDHVQYGR